MSRAIRAVLRAAEFKPAESSLRERSVPLVDAAWHAIPEVAADRCRHLLKVGPGQTSITTMLPLDCLSSYTVPVPQHEHYRLHVTRRRLYGRSFLLRRQLTSSRVSSRLSSRKVLALPFTVDKNMLEMVSLSVLATSMASPITALGNELLLSHTFTQRVQSLKAAVSILVSMCCSHRAF